MKFDEFVERWNEHSRDVERVRDVNQVDAMLDILRMLKEFHFNIEFAVDHDMIFLGGARYHDSWAYLPTHVIIRLTQLGLRLDRNVESFALFV